MLRMSRMEGLGAPAQPFSLPDTQGNIVSLDDFAGSPALLVAFICNHCPFVLHVIDELVAFAKDYAPKGLAMVAISSNDPADYPDDDAAHMTAFVQQYGLTFPYLHDETQSVALAYGAICTPDFFLFGPDRTLFYAGQFDSSRPKINRPPVPGLLPLRTDLPVTGEDLRAAVDALLTGEAPPSSQRASAGCSIKWREDRQPSWA
ncbi:thioredoxin family protein [Sphingobium sp. WCS2017Hpa-17]|uniref:thioredoxin family protein n=1 Tax=Sphingobium sp. WCS2017Hpa-17 TaxID=3073638 RepID=UPI0028892613|nr:thioredoxin family protein [Sphingobium sp. WCS2017Hpa-17]